MSCKIVFTVSLCLLLLTIASCSAPEAAPSAETVVTTEVQVAEAVEAEPTVAPEAETAETEPEQPTPETSEAIVTLGDKKLTMEQLNWMQPNVNDQQMVKIVDWWIENELIYEEAVRRGTDKEQKVKFLAELMSKRTITQELRTRVMDAVQINDQQISEYYEKNKETDPRLKQPGYLSFAHVKTRTLEQANAALERIKAGESVSALAKELSIHSDAKNGGIIKKHPYTRVQKVFGNEFFEALVAANEGQLIGPIKVSDGYEIARQENKAEPRFLTLEEAKDRIRMRLLYEERNNSFRSLLDSLKQKAADKIVKSPRLIQAEKPPQREPGTQKQGQTGESTKK